MSSRLETSALIIFALALFITAASPGPSLAALVARVLVRGWRDVAPFLIAMWLGELIWLCLTIAGLTAIALTFHWVFTILKFCGVGYLIFLAWQMWTAPVAINCEMNSLESGSSMKMFLTGLAVTLGNPKIMLFYIALLPTIVDLEGVTSTGWLQLTVTLLAVIAVVDITYVVLATRARVLLRSPNAVRFANRLGASLMGTAAAAIAVR